MPQIILYYAGLTKNYHTLTNLDLRKAPPSPDQLTSADSGLSSLDVVKTTSPSVKPLSARADLPWERAILRKSSKDSLSTHRY